MPRMHVICMFRGMIRPEPYHTKVWLLPNISVVTNQNLKMSDVRYFIMFHLKNNPIIILEVLSYIVLRYWDSTYSDKKDKMFHSKRLAISVIN